jgi:GT2 family glycosyltransferase
VGVAAARNRGAAVASGELLLFCDDDIVVSKDNLRRHESVHAGEERCLVSGRWEFDPAVRLRLEMTPLGRYRLRYEDLYNKPDTSAAVDEGARVYARTLAAANLSIRRSAFASLDGFDERFPVGGEDQDLTWRAHRAGYKLVYDSSICVIHNDQHSDLRALCRRQERAAIGSVCFAAKNPDLPVPTLIELNGPLRRGDDPLVMMRKVSRTAVSSRAVLALAHRLVSTVERLRPSGGWPLEFLYGAIGGLYVFRGVRRGLKLTAGPDWGHDLKWVADTQRRART